MIKTKTSVQRADASSKNAGTHAAEPGTNNHRSAGDTPALAHALETQLTGNTDVRSRAYDIYCERGRIDGHEVDDWCQAERDVSSLCAGVDSEDRISVTNTSRDDAPSVSPSPPVKGRS
jgi:hypothetical protein